MARRSRLAFLSAAAVVCIAAACDSRPASPISACSDEGAAAQVECACERNPHDARCVEGGAPSIDSGADATDASDAADSADAVDAADAADSSDASSDAPDDAPDGD
jgi:hypothetical protein